jgi:hypothetical protein
MTWQSEHVRINWTDRSIEHIAKHNVEPYEVEEGLFEDDPKIDQTKKRSPKYILPNNNR